VGGVFALVCCLVAPRGSLVLVYTEASTVLKTVAADFYFNCWCLEIPTANYSACTQVLPLSCTELSIESVLGVEKMKDVLCQIF
jgi:hypothetical protein